MESIEKNNNDLRKKKKYFKLSDEQVIANFLQCESLSDKAVETIKEVMPKTTEKSVSEDTMAYKINKSGDGSKEPFLPSLHSFPVVASE